MLCYMDNGIHGYLGVVLYQSGTRNDTSHRTSYYCNDPKFLNRRVRPRSGSRVEPLCLSFRVFPALLRYVMSEYLGITLKFLNFGTPKNFAVIYLKFRQIGQTLKGIVNFIARPYFSVFRS